MGRRSKTKRRQKSARRAAQVMAQVHDPLNEKFLAEEADEEECVD